MTHSDRFYTVPEQENGRSAAIVGSGPSGLTAAYYLRKAGAAVTVYESQDEPGGMLIYAIPPYRLPREIVRDFTGCLRDMGVRFICGQKVGADVTPEELEKLYDTVLYATGTWKRPVIGIAGEDLTNFGLDFLAEAGRWMKGKEGTDIIVCGGGNVAMDVAVTAKRLGAAKVTLVCLEPRERMPASAEEITRAEEEGITVMPSLGLSRVISEGGRINGLEVKRCISPWDEAGVFDPQYDEEDLSVLETQSILMAIGQKSDLSFLDEKYQVQVSGRGLIETLGESQLTSRHGVFASGDVTTGSATVIGAVAGGRRAASGMLDFLGIGGAGSDADGKPEISCDCGREFLHFDAEGILREDALRLRSLDKEKRSLDLEDSSSPTIEEVRREAARCRNCGCYSVFPSDTASAIVALDAVIITSRRRIAAEEFFEVRVPGSTVLEPDEIVTEILVPAPADGSRSAFKKMAWRKSIDFPVVNCAVRMGGEPRVCIGAVAPVPYRARAAEEVLRAETIDETVCESAGDAAVRDAAAFETAAYKIQIARVLVKNALLEVK
jgi:NADPH-dependent glutamate synthase beta subunit-like oxidoreductase/CO/xanthine dehydrogenase FAD-binding subunit